MSKATRPSALRRRDLLKAAGLGVVAMSLLPAWRPPAERPAPSGATRPLGIGVLLPEVARYPSLSESLLGGMRLFIEQSAGRAAGLVLAEAARSTETALEQARHLLEHTQVEIVVAGISPLLAGPLGQLCRASHTPLVVAHVGAHALSAAEQSPGVLHSTLGHWQANWAMGAWAGRHLGRRAFLAASHYDSGYDALYAFQVGLESAGGQLLETRITHLSTDCDDLSSLWTEIHETKPDFVYGLYCGQPALEFVQGYTAAGLAKEIPLAGSAFVVGEDILPQLGPAALGIKTALAWASDPSRPADPVAALGYDTTRRILATCTGGGQLTAEAWPEDTPRLYLREVRSQQGRLANVALEELAVPPDLEARFQAARSGPRTGWLNAYLT